MIPQRGAVHDFVTRAEGVDQPTPRYLQRLDIRRDEQEYSRASTMSTTVDDVYLPRASSSGLPWGRC